MPNRILIISGPTACGKTNLVYQLADQLPIEIINADIGSMYQPLIIGTAKPNWKQSKIPHHAFDILSQPEQFSIVQFRTLVQKLISEIQSRGNISVIVGGSTMYIKSLFFNMREMPDTTLTSQALLKTLQSGQTTSENLWNELHAVDSIRAAQIHKNDAYRIVQALAIWKTTQQKPSEFGHFFDPIAQFYWINGQCDRARLYERINQRVIAMVEQGWVQEVEALQNTQWRNFLMQKKIIGYDDLLSHLTSGNQSNIDLVIAKIQQKTRHYAKRQILFFKKLQSDINIQLLNQPHIGLVHDLNLTLCDDGLYIKRLSKQILQNLK